MSHKAGRQQNAAYYARHASHAADDVFQAKQSSRLRRTVTGGRVDRFEAEFTPQRPATPAPQQPKTTLKLVKTSRNGKRKYYNVVR